MALQALLQSLLADACVEEGPPGGLGPRSEEPVRQGGPERLHHGGVRGDSGNEGPAAVLLQPAGQGDHAGVASQAPLGPMAGLHQQSRPFPQLTMRQVLPSDGALQVLVAEVLEHELAHLLSAGARLPEVGEGGLVA